jgi:hypothetical protein
MITRSNRLSRAAAPPRMPTHHQPELNHRARRQRPSGGEGVFEQLELGEKVRLSTPSLVLYPGQSPFRTTSMTWSVADSNVRPNRADHAHNGRDHPAYRRHLPAVGQARGWERITVPE